MTHLKFLTFLQWPALLGPTFVALPFDLARFSLSYFLNLLYNAV